ncbi:MAG: Uma2 family endonuclease [Bacteroidota bacterium]
MIWNDSDTSTSLTKKFRFTTKDYYKLGEIGIFDGKPRVELLDGIIYYKHIGEPFRFSSADYYRMGDAGIFSGKQRVELINGEIIIMSPVNSPHASTVKTISRLLHKLLGENFLIGVQDPVDLFKDSDPEPDLSILKSRADNYYTAHPTPDDIVLLIEVADSTLQSDRKTKLPLYAEAGIEVVWIVNLQDQQVEVYQTPVAQRYKTINIYTKEDEIPTNLGITLAAASILIAPAS